MRCHISGGWLVGMPDVIFHQNTVEAVIAAPKPPWVNHTPRSVRDDLSHTNAIVFEMPRNSIFTRAHHRRGDPAHRYRIGSGSGSVTGGAFSGDFWGGGGVTGSRVGDTGSFRGMTVYLLIGSPIWATADLSRWMGQRSTAHGDPSTRSLPRHCGPVAADAGGHALWTHIGACGRHETLIPQ